MNEIKKAIVPVAGLGTRFLPLSKVLPKELFPLVDKPVLQYIIEEAVASGIEEIIFTTRPDKKEVVEYFERYFRESPRLTEILKKRQKNELLEKLNGIEKMAEKIKFSQVYQKEPLGDGHAILQTKDKVGGETVAALWGDDVVESQIPCLLQLIRVFQKYQKPVIALCRIPKERLPYYGVVAAQKVQKGVYGVYKIKKLVEKPQIDEAPSNLAVVGKYILTPRVFEYLAEAKPGKGGEILLSENLQKMINNGEEVMGYEIEGKWLECGNKAEWLKSHLYLTLKDPEFGPQLRKTLKEYLK